MKTKVLLFIPLLTYNLLVLGCHSPQQYQPDKQIINAFKSKYPQAKKTTWESKEGFYVADFHHDATESEAWFDHKGEWILTKNEIQYHALPQDIRNALEKSDFNTWKKEEVIQIERPDIRPIYIIEAEKGDQEIDLYFTENGRLVKTTGDLKPGSTLHYAPLPLEIQNQIKQKYPQAVLIDIDREKGKYEIDIIDQGKNKEVVFYGNNWKTTSWEVSKTEVPNAVMETYRKSAYNKYRIDDIHFFETPANNYYHFELEDGKQEVNLSIDPNGKIVKEEIRK